MTGERENVLRRYLNRLSRATVQRSRVVEDCTGSWHQKPEKGKKVNVLFKPLMENSMTQLQSVTCHMGSHSITFYPTQVNAPRLHPSQTGWYSIYRPFKDGGLSNPRSRVQRATGPRLLYATARGQRDPNPQPNDR